MHAFSNSQSSAEAGGYLPESEAGQCRRSCASLLLASALLVTTACGGDLKPPELSSRAQKGLSIAPFQIDVTGLTIAEQERIGAGSYFINAISPCNECHQSPQPNGPPKYMGGGISFPVGPAGELVYARNLTPDPDTGLKLTEAEFIEAMRTGKDFKSEDATEQLLVMPWFTFRWMTEEDLKSIYAYLKKVPPVRNPVPADIKGAAGAEQPVPFPSKQEEGETSRSLPAEKDSGPLNSERGLAMQPLADPPALGGLSANDRFLYGRGSYLVNSIGDCNGCHTNPLRDFAPGPNNLKIPTAYFLTGGQPFPTPPGLDEETGYMRVLSANLLGAEHGAMPKLTYEQFRRTISHREIVRDSFSRSLAYPMSLIAEGLDKAEEEDLKAIYTYLKHQVPRTGVNDKRVQPPARYCTQNTDCNTSAGETCNDSTHECVGATCEQDFECGACQTCTANKCVAPSSTSACLVGGT